MTNSHMLPTFHELRLKHGIALEAMYEYAEQEISLDEIRLFDETGRADPYTVDDLLFVLSKLSGKHYNRTHVRGVIFILARPPASPSDPQPQAGPLPAPPTLLDLYYGYTLHLDWLGEALRMENREVWDVLRGDASKSEDAERVLHLISQYTGVASTLDMIRSPQQLTSLKMR